MIYCVGIRETAGKTILYTLAHRPITQPN